MTKSKDHIYSQGYVTWHLLKWALEMSGDVPTQEDWRHFCSICLTLSRVQRPNTAATPLLESKDTCYLAYLHLPVLRMGNFPHLSDGGNEEEN